MESFEHLKPGDLVYIVGRNHVRRAWVERLTKTQIVLNHVKTRFRIENGQAIEKYDSYYGRAYLSVPNADLDERFQRQTWDSVLYQVSRIDWKEVPIETVRKLTQEIKNGLGERIAIGE